MPPKAALRAVSNFHKTLFRISGGRLGATLRGGQVVFLTTTGRKTGKERTWPLVGVPHGGDWLVIGSNNGADEHPSWYLNVTANPEVSLAVNNITTKMRARVATGDERTELWAYVTTEQHVFTSYESKTSRQIPVVVLSTKP